MPEEPKEFEVTKFEVTPSDDNMSAYIFCTLADGKRIMLRADREAIQQLYSGIGPIATGLARPPKP
jgi:hypothetical protein